ncbi:MAG: hypothetical protein JW833_08320, partial [Prolixibacteraceae bacterium]|nr:hypothetical protein [Prolixibacteraceae bacterium]
MSSAQNNGTKQNYKTAARELKFPSKDTIHSVGIIYDGDEGPPLPNPGEFGTSVSTEEFCFKKGKRLDNKNSNIVFSSDLNLFKLPPKRIIKPFIEKEFDILINFTDGTNHPLNYICAKSKA